jgi:hypothetical protein
VQHSRAPFDQPVPISDVEGQCFLQQFEHYPRLFRALARSLQGSDGFTLVVPPAPRPLQEQFGAIDMLFWYTAAIHSGS